MLNKNHHHECVEEEFDIELMKYFIGLPAEEKLKKLQRLNEFAYSLTTEETRQINRQLRDEGF